MGLENTVYSVRKIVNSDLARHFFVDTSATGYCFANSHPIEIRASRLKPKELRSISAKDSLKSAEAFTKFIEEHPHVRGSSIVLEELDMKMSSLIRFVGLYSSLVCGSNNGAYSDNSHKKRKSYLRQLLVSECKSINLLKERLPRQDEIQSDLIKKMVIASSKRIIPPNSNYNDEIIVGEAIYHAFSKREPVSIITRDRRFKEIVKGVERFLDGNSRFRPLHNFLDGKLSIVLGTNGHYEVEYKYKKFN